jgi:hypothetical protein
MTTVPIAELTDAQRRRVTNTARALALGRLDLPPLRCHHCRSPHLERHQPGQLRCDACTNITYDTTAHRARRLEIADLLRAAAGDA